MGLVWFVAFIIVLAALPAWGSSTCARPMSRRAELAIEEHGAIYGPGEDGPRRQSHVVELKYGFNDRWEAFVGVSGGDL